MERVLKVALLVGAACLSTSIAAEPVVYEFEGYIANRYVLAGLTDLDTDRHFNLPAGFAPGVKFKGRMTYDRDIRYFDADANEERAAPVTNIWVRTETGGYLTQVGRTYSGGPEVQKMTAHEVHGHSTMNQVNGATEFLADLHVAWEGPNSELTAPGVGTFRLMALEPGCAIEHCSRREFAIGYITRAGKAAPATWTSTAWDFSSTATGWEPRGGTTWTVVNGYYRSSTNAQAAMAVSSIPITGNFTFSASVYLEWTASGNRGGLVYDYLDDSNYRGVLVSANSNTSSSSGQPGVLEIFEVTNGVRRVVATRTHTMYKYTWSPLSISRINGVTKINDVDVTQSPVHGGKVGLLARWNVVRFDDVVLARPTSN